MNNLVANENEMLGKLNELNNDKENNDVEVEVEDATKKTINKIKNKATNITNITTDNSKSLVRIVFDNTN